MKSSTKNNFNLEIVNIPSIESRKYSSKPKDIIQELTKFNVNPLFESIFNKNMFTDDKSTLSNKDRQQQSYVRNLLESSDVFYKEETLRRNREYSQKLKKQIEENKRKKEYQKQQQILDQKKLIEKIRKDQIELKYQYLNQNNYDKKVMVSLRNPNYKSNNKKRMRSAKRFQKSKFKNFHNDKLNEEQDRIEQNFSVVKTKNGSLENSIVNFSQFVDSHQNDLSDTLHESHFNYRNSVQSKTKFERDCDDHL